MEEKTKPKEGNELVRVAAEAQERLQVVRDWLKISPGNMSPTEQALRTQLDAARAEYSRREGEIKQLRTALQQAVQEAARAQVEIETVEAVVVAANK